MAHLHLRQCCCWPFPYINFFGDQAIGSHIYCQQKQQLGVSVNILLILSSIFYYAKFTKKFVPFRSLYTRKSASSRAIRLLVRDLHVPRVLRVSYRPHLCVPLATWFHFSQLVNLVLILLSVYLVHQVSFRFH